MNQRRTLTTAARGAKNVARASPAPSVAHEAKDPPVREDAAARHERIAVQAYYLAEKRGFIPGAELDNWLAAEARGDTQPREPRTEAHAKHGR
jgi:hypothetical protein